jgi:tetratricopeptide (TPR) repeat protein
LKIQPRINFLFLFFFILGSAVIADTLYDAALMERSGRLEEAFQLYESWLIDNKDDPRFSDILFYTSSFITSVDMSLDFLIKFENDIDVKNRQRYYFRIAQLYEMSFQKYNASVYYEKASKNIDDTINFEYYLKFLTLNYQMGEIPSIDALNPILLSAKNTQVYTAALIFKAELLKYNGEMNSAITILEQSVYKDNSPEIQLALWDLYLLSNNIPAANEVIKTMKLHFPDSIELKIMKGDITKLVRLSDFFLTAGETVNSELYYIQVGTFSNPENISEVSRQLKDSGFEFFLIEENQNRKIIVVDSDLPENLLARLRKIGFDGFRINYQQYPE